MVTPSSYQAKRFRLSGLKGLSDESLELHLRLYEGYVQEANRLTDRIDKCLKGGQVD